MVCGFNFEDTYCEIGLGYIEAHHLTPFSELKGRPTQLDPKTDFAVPYMNCHRMLHKVSPPLTPDELIARMSEVRTVGSSIWLSQTCEIYWKGGGGHNVTGRGPRRSSL